MSPDRAVPWAVAALLAVALVAMAAAGFPLLDGDAVAFVPNALYQARGEGLINPFWERAVALDPAGLGRLTWHGFLYPLALASLAPSPGVTGVLAAVGVVSALSLLAATAAMRRVVPTPGPVLGTGIIVAIAASLVGLAGRPETLCIAIVAAALACRQWRGPWLGPAAIGACIALLTLTSPVLAVVSAGLLAPGAWSVERGGPIIAPLVALLLGAAATLALGASLYPWPFGDWFIGLWQHSAVAMEASGGSRFRHLASYLVLNPAAPMIGVLAALALARRIAGAGAVASPLSRAGAGIAATALAVLLWRRPEQTYYLVGLLPVWIESVAAPGPRPRAFRLATATLLLVLASPLVLTSLQFVEYRGHGTSLHDARARFTALDVPAGASVRVTRALWVLSDTYRLEAWEPGGNRGADYVLVQQVNSGRLSPPAIEGYVMTSSDFVEHPPRWFGVPIGRATKSYAFAVYQPTEGRD